MENLLTVKNLTKSFKEKQVLRGISFEVRQGEVLCILGPNGAGKSTTINILTAALGSDGGELYFSKAQGSTAALLPALRELLAQRREEIP